MAGGKETPKEEKQEPSVRRGSKSIWPWKKETDGSANFLRAARAGNLEKVLEFLKTNTDINTCNANGLNALHLASKEGHTDVVSALLDRSANVDAATKKGNTALHIASLAGQDEIVKVLVEHGATVNIQSQNGFTPLYMAAQENHDSVVRFLLSHGANQSLATEDGFTPLAVALQQGHDRVVSVLLENDTRGKVRLPALHIAAKKDDAKAAALLLHTDHNPDITSKSGFTPLHIASHYGNDNIAGLLIQRGADVNYVAKHQITPLHVASKWGKGNMVSLLLDKGANIEAKTRDGLTPLHCAARSGHETVVDMLLEKGAPITAKTKNGLAPLHMASQGDHVDAARILLYHKAPVDDVTVDFLTALHVAAHCGHVRVAKLLLDRKADPNSRALNGFTPLHIACKKNRIKVVELLLKHGASIEATTESGLTPLHVASFMGCMNIVIYLIQHGASADVPTVRGESPLHLAARANQTDIIRILLRNGAEVDAKAREQQTALHIASRLGNTDIVGLLLQQGASVDAPTKDLYTPLHIAAKEGQEEVAGVLLDHGASLNTPTKKGFTPLHLAAKYGHLKVARLLLQREAPVDPKGKNGVTPLHVAAHYDHQNVAMLLLDKGAQPHATAKNGYTPLHIAARKNQMDIAGTLLEYGANANAESKAGFTPLHLSAQEGHTDMATLLLEHGAQPGGSAKNGLTPLHLCAQEDRVPVGAILVKHGATVDAETKAGYTPLHVAAHFGQMNMVRFLLQHGTKVDAPTQLGYTPLHQAAQQGHTQIVNLLLENKAQPNMETNDGKTALSIAQRLGYISVVETLKIVTETRVTTNTTTTTEEKYKVVVPETMHETFMSESEDEGADDTMLGDQSYRYLTVDEMKSLGDDSLPIDVTRDEKMDVSFQSNLGTAPGEHISPQHKKESLYSQNYPTDNIDVGKAPILAGPESLNTTMNTTFNPPEDDAPQFNDESRTEVPDQGTTPKSQTPATVTPKTTQNEEVANIWDQFLVSFMVDARGGAMRGCRHSGVRVIIPPRKAAMPTRITCRYLKKDKLVHAPPLMEGEALSSRILEMGPSGAKFLGPVIIEVPHFASLRGKEREIVILRSDNGETWREHTLEATEEAVQEVLNESFDGEELKQLEDLNTSRITRILTTDFPQYFAIVTRIRQEVHAIGPEGGMVSSTVVPQVQAVFPQGALTKKIKVGLQAQPISTDLVAKLLGNRVAVSPIVTVEPRRRKFHKPITLTIPVPQAASKGMINQYSGEAPTLRLLCSITGGTTRAQWEDVTGSTPLTFVNDCVSFTTTVSARFWLMDCTNIPEATKMATELYREAIHVPFMAKFVVFSKRHQLEEARVRVFCMTDDKEDKTLESQEHFIEVAKSRDVEVLEGKSQYLEFAGNLIPVTKSGDQLAFNFYAFRENRLPFTVRVKDQNAESAGRVAFMRQPKVGRGEAPQSPICTLNLSLPDNIQPEPAPSEPDLLALEKKYAFLSISKAETIHKADLRLSDISNMLASDWVALAKELLISDSDINIIKTQYPDNTPQQAIVMLRLWMQTSGNRATGNTLEKALRTIHRDDIVDECICNMEVVTDVSEKATAEEVLVEKKSVEEITPAYDEKDIMKDAESVEEEEIAHKTLTVSIEEEQEVSELPVVPQSRSSTTYTTSQVIVESVREPENEEIEDDVVQSVYDSRIHQEVDIKPEDHFALKFERVSDSKESSDSEGNNEESFSVLVDTKQGYSLDSEAVVEEIVSSPVEFDIVTESKDITSEELSQPLRDVQKLEDIEGVVSEAHLESLVITEDDHLLDDRTYQLEKFPSEIPEIVILEPKSPELKILEKEDSTSSKEDLTSEDLVEISYDEPVQQEQELLYQTKEEQVMPSEILDIRIQDEEYVKEEKQHQEEEIQDKEQEIHDEETNIQIQEFEEETKIQNQEFDKKTEVEDQMHDKEAIIQELVYDQVKDFREQVYDQEEEMEDLEYDQEERAHDQDYSLAGKIYDKESVQDQDYSQAEKIYEESTQNQDYSQTEKICDEERTRDQDYSQAQKIWDEERTQDQDYSQAQKIYDEEVTQDQDYSQAQEIYNEEMIQDQDYSQAEKIYDEESTQDQDYSQAEKIYEGEKTQDQDYSQGEKIYDEERIQAQDYSQAENIYNVESTEDQGYSQAQKIYDEDINIQEQEFNEDIDIEDQEYLHKERAYDEDINIQEQEFNEDIDIEDQEFVHKERAKDQEYLEEVKIHDQIYDKEISIQEKEFDHDLKIEDKDFDKEAEFEKEKYSEITTEIEEARIQEQVLDQETKIQKSDKEVEILDEEYDNELFIQESNIKVETHKDQPQELFIQEPLDSFSHEESCESPVEFEIISKEDIESEEYDAKDIDSQYSKYIPQVEEVKDTEISDVHDKDKIRLVSDLEEKVVHETESESDAEHLSDQEPDVLYEEEDQLITEEKYELEGKEEEQLITEEKHELEGKEEQLITEEKSELEEKEEQLITEEKYELEGEEEQLITEEKYELEGKEEQLIVSNQYAEQDLIQDTRISENLSESDQDRSQDVEKEIDKEKESEQKHDHPQIEETKVSHSRLDYSSDDDPSTSMEPLDNSEFAFENKYFQEYESDREDRETVPKSEFLIESEIVVDKVLLEQDLPLEFDHEDVADSMEAFDDSENQEDVEKEAKPQDGLTQPSAETSQMEPGQTAPSDVKPPTASVADQPTSDIQLTEKVAGVAYGVNVKSDEDAFPSRVSNRGYSSEESLGIISKDDAFAGDLINESIKDLGNKIYHLEATIESSQNVITNAGESSTKSSGIQALEEDLNSNGFSGTAHRPTTLNISYSGEVDENESNDSCSNVRENELVLSLNQIPVVNRSTEWDEIEEESSNENDTSAHRNHIHAISASSGIIQKPEEHFDIGPRIERLSRPSTRSAILKVKFEKRLAANQSAKEKNNLGSKENIQYLPQVTSMTLQNKSQNTSIEDEVLGLMAEVQEVTKEIKMDVKLLRDSESPTPETPTPLREFKDFICKEEELESVRLPTICEIGKEADEEGTSCGIAGEMDSNLTYKNHIGTLSLCPNQTQLKASINNSNLADISQNKQNHEILGEASAAFPCDVDSVGLNSLNVKTHASPKGVLGLKMPSSNRFRAISRSLIKPLFNRAFTQTNSNLSSKPYETLSDFRRSKASLISVRSCYFCTRDFLLNDVCNDLIEIISFVEQGVKLSKKLNTDELISSLDNVKLKLGSIFEEKVDENIEINNKSVSKTSFDIAKSELKSPCDSISIENESDHYINKNSEGAFLTMPSVKNDNSDKHPLLLASNAISEGNVPDYLIDVEEIQLEDESTQVSPGVLKKTAKRDEAESGEDKFTDEEDIENSDLEDGVETEKDEEMAIENFLPDNPRNVLSLTEGYARDSSPILSEGEYENIDIVKRHLRNVRVASVVAEGLDSEEIIQDLTDEENMIDVVNDLSESEKEEDVGSSLPDHYLQEDDSVSKHEAVSSVSLSKNELGIKKSIPHDRHSLQVHVEAEEKTDVEDLSAENSTCLKKPKRRKARAKKAKSLSCPPSAVIPEFSGGSLTDTETLPNSSDSSSDGYVEGFDENYLATVRALKEFTDTEDVNVSDGDEEDLFASPVPKDEPQFIPEPIPEKINISEVSEKEIIENIQADTDEEDFHLEDREDKKPLSYSAVNPPLSTQFITHHSNSSEGEDALTDIDDINVDDKDDEDIINDYIERFPIEDSSVLLDMECESASNVKGDIKKIETKTYKRLSLSLKEEDNEALTDIEEWDEKGGVNPVGKELGVKKQNKSNETDSENIEDSEDEKILRRKSRKIFGRSKTLPIVSQLSEVKFIETESGPLSIIVTPDTTSDYSSSFQDSVRGVVFFEEENEALTDVEEIGTPVVETKHKTETADPNQEQVTDTEDFEGQDVFSDRPATPLPPNILEIPSPMREKIYIVEDEFGVPHVRIENLDAFASDISEEVEQVDTDTDNIDIPESEIPLVANTQNDNDELDFFTLPETGISQVSSKFKTRKGHQLKARDCPLTDEEDISCRKKGKRKYKSKRRYLEAKVEEEGNTDVELLNESGEKILSVHSNTEQKQDTRSETEYEEFDSSEEYETYANESEFSPKFVHMPGIMQVVLRTEQSDGSVKTEIMEEKNSETKTVTEDTKATTDTENVEISEAEEVYEGFIAEECPSSSLPVNEESSVSVSLKAFPSHARRIAEAEEEIKENLLLPEAGHTDVESLEEGEEIGETKTTPDDSSKPEASIASLKSPLMEVDLAVLDSLLISQEAEIEEMSSDETKPSANVDNKVEQISSLDHPKPPVGTADTKIKSNPPLPPPRTIFNKEKTPIKKDQTKDHSVEESIELGEHFSSDDADDQLALMKDSPRWEDEEIKAEDPANVRPIKAEIKLMVKTTEVGKESIEIRSIREFLDPSDKSILPKNIESEKQHLDPHQNKGSDQIKPVSPHHISHDRSASSPKFVRPKEKYSSLLYEEGSDDFDLLAQVRDIIEPLEKKKDSCTPIGKDPQKKEKDPQTSQ